jgi:Subtilase family
MADHRNFLLGKGERLTEPVSPAKRAVNKVPPYTPEEARDRLTPMVRAAVSNMARLPEDARPRGQVVGKLVLNPEYLSKSYYPSNFLKSYGLRAVGSKPTTVTPEKRSNNRDPVEQPSTELFVAGPLAEFNRLYRDLSTAHLSDSVRDELVTLERIEEVHPRSKIKGPIKSKQHIPLEVVLHASEFRTDQFIVDAFNTYVSTMGLEADLEHRLYAGGLCFLRMSAPKESISDIVKFSFLRAVREMPRLRHLEPKLDFRTSAPPVILPTADVVAPTIRVAVFDGGLPDRSPLDPWVRRFDPPGIGPAVPKCVDHGHAVTSAALFGPLVPGTQAPTPFATVDHIRVWDDESGSDPLHLFDVLERIKNTLETSPKYEFINLSIGPDLPIEDDDVHSWTAVLDEYLAEGTCLATVAVGNDGDGDAAAQLNRVQVPSDSVNALGVGACNTRVGPWQRAPYSSVGPGRSPGVVKPDLVAFGGGKSNPYLALVPGKGLNPEEHQGTSFAAPELMRVAVGIKSTFGASLGPLAIRALLIHTAEAGQEPQADIGRGRIRIDLDEISICPDGSYRVVYRGELSASKYLRAEIPLPDGVIKGNVKIDATCCFATEIDSAYPSGYTRSGLEVVFRPDYSNVDNGAMHPHSQRFFSRPEEFRGGMLRSDAHKWETTLHGSVTKRASGLNRPVFDIHYLARDEGRPDHASVKIRYALVITVEAPRNLDLYDRIVRKYRNVLEPMVPIRVPVQI